MADCFELIGKTTRGSRLSGHWETLPGGRVCMLHEQHDSMDPSGLVAKVQAAAGSVTNVWDIFLAHFSPRSFNSANPNTRVHSFMTTV